MFNKIIITIDGPAGSGKSTSAKKIAQKLGLTYLDTGAMYRAITYLAIKNNVISNETKIIEIAETTELDLEFRDGTTYVKANGEDLTSNIRSFEVNSKVSDVSRIPAVRTALVKKQQEIGNNHGVIAEGRDTGTVVFPNADVKIFLVADLDERANRRLKEFNETAENISLTQIKENLSKRDYIDSNREVSPLLKADDAIEIDTSDITIEQQVNIILKKIEERTKKNLSNY